jgi:dTDP-glucose 4,6-dehydratase
MITLLITGIAGFIGSNYAHFAVKHHPDYQIVGVDKLTPYSCRENIATLEARGAVKFYCADIANYAEMEAIYKRHKPTYVINFAAESHNDRAINNPTSFVHSNALGAQTMVELSRQYGVHRHIHISTIEVYGEQGPDIPYFTEASPLNAKTPYSAAKAAGDIIIRAYMQTYKDMDICMTHCANNYGPYQFPEKLIPLAITNILRGKKAPLYGDGLQKRDWLHVIDHCRGIDLVVHQKQKPTFGEEAATHTELLPIYDFSARHEVTNKEILERVCEALGRTFAETVEYVADRPNHDRRYLINPAKAEGELGFKPEISFDSGLEETVRWYVANREWWERIIERQGELSIDWSTFGKAAV